MNVPYKTRRLGFAGDPRVPFAWAGWNDALNGKPLDYYLLDRAPTPACAQAYETARYRVMALRDAKLTVPRWNSMKVVPPAIHAALSLTNSLQAMARDEGAPYWPTGNKFWRAAA
jgi:hypothetical protein